MTTRLLVLLACLFLAACSSDNSDEQAAGEAGDLIGGAELALLPDSQRGLLEDGEVSLSDYNAAMENARSCMQEAGWSANEVFGIPQSDRLTFNVRFEDSPDSPTPDEDLDLCVDEHVGTVERLYLASLAPEGADRDAKLVELAQCLNRAGVVVPPGSATEAEFVIAIVASLPEDMLGNGFSCMDANASLFVD